MRMMALLLLFVANPGFAAEPFGRASVEGAEGLVPGQQVHVLVDIFAPDFFTSPPQFPLFEVADALVTLSDDHAQNLLQTIDGVQYSGIRKSYIVVPEKTGSFQLPKIDVEFGYSTEGKATKALVKIPLPSFDVVAAPGAAISAFAAQRLTLTETFDRDPAQLKAGDALVRTIIVFAEDTQALLIPPVDVGRAEGAAQYVKQPILADGVEQRGVGRSVETGSTRTETVAYTVPKAGTFRLPTVSYQWFDLEAHAGATASLPSVEVIVAAAPLTAGKGIIPTSDEEPGNVHSHVWQALLALALVGLAAGALGRRHPSNLGAWVRRVREARRNSLAGRRCQLLAVIRAGHEAAVYRALQDWYGRLGFRTMADWVESEGNPYLDAQVAILERRLFRSRDIELDRSVLAGSIAIPQSPPRGAASALPELNPSR